MRSRFALCLAAACSFAADTMPAPAERQLARDIYQQLIEIKSGYSTGPTTPAAEAIAERLRSEGFLNADIFLGGAIPTKGNLVVRYRGSGHRKPVLLLAHTDVVEAKREDWSVEPFVLTERDGYFYGRGTADDKAQAALWIANLIRYKREGFVPDRDIIVALTADEEGGGPYNGVAWLLKNHRDLIDAEFALNEGGYGEEQDGKRISNDVQLSEKYVIDFRLEVHNPGGHSSLPVADNAIYHLSAALERLSHFAFPLKTNEVTRAYFTQRAKLESSALGVDLAAVGTGSQDAMQHVAAASPQWNSMLRTTCVATQLEGGHARNALPQLAAANINCRVLPEDSPEYVETTLKNILADPQVQVKVQGEIVRGPASPSNAFLMHSIERITDSLWPTVPVLQIMLVGATDGLYLRSAGIPTYGVQGFFADPKDRRVHGRDERLSVRSFYEGESFLYELVKTLSSSNQ